MALPCQDLNTLPVGHGVGWVSSRGWHFSVNDQLTQSEQHLPWQHCYLREIILCATRIFDANLKTDVLFYS